jgi:hypothetical protein
MKQGYLADEQKFFINGTQLSGVQSVEGSYQISEKPINVLGWGLVGADYYPPEPKIELEDKDPNSCYGFVITEQGEFDPITEVGMFDIMQEDVYSCPEEKPRHCPNPNAMALLNAPMEGNFTVNSTLVSEDFFLQFLGDNYFTGSLHHPCHGYFGFSSGYITNHTVSCQVGQIPATSTNIRVFGDIGGSPDVMQQEPSQCVIMDEYGYALVIEDSYYNNNIPGYNAKGESPFPEIRIPDQGSISIQCTGAETDRVVAFEHSIDIPIDPIYVVGSAYAAQVDVVWPITTNTSFTLEIDEYGYQSLRKYMITPTVHDIGIKINDCFGDPIQHYNIEKARLLGESVSSSVDGRLTVNLKYQSYYNKRGLRPHANDFTTSTFKETMWSPSLLRPVLWNDALDRNYLKLDGYSLTEWMSKGQNNHILSPEGTASNPRMTQYIFNKKPAINFFERSSLTTRQINISKDKPFYIFLAGQFKNKDTRSVVVDTLSVPLDQPLERLLIERLESNNIKVSTQQRVAGGGLFETGVIKSKGDKIVNAVLDESYQEDKNTIDTIKVEPFILTVFVNGDNSYLDINGRSSIIEGSLGRVSIDAFTLGSVMTDMESSINGFIAESIIIEDFLPDSQLFNVQGYLAHKWGFTELLRPGHLYQFDMPMI